MVESVRMREWVQGAPERELLGAAGKREKCARERGGQGGTLAAIKGRGEEKGKERRVGLSVACVMPRIDKYSVSIPHPHPTPPAPPSDTHLGKNLKSLGSF